jgi:ribonuclease Z
MQVTFLGTSAARPTVERNVTSITIAREGETMMFDCGEGTQRQMMRFGVSFTLSDIFITHFHADHYLGLAGLLRTFGLQGRTEKMTLYGPSGAERVLGQMVSLGFERIPFPVDIVEVKPGDKFDRGEYDIVVFRADHGRNAVGYALVEHQRLGRFSPEKARGMGIPEGPLWGQLHKGETVTLDDGTTVDPADLVGPSRPGRKIVFTGDTKPSSDVVDISLGADLLIHDATFTNEEKERANDTSHSTALGAAQVALSAGVKQLAITHLSARFSTDFYPLLQEAKEVFEDTVVAKDGMKIKVGFPDEEDPEE